MDSSRRGFLKSVATGAVVAGVGSRAAGAAEGVVAPEAVKPVMRRKFGKIETEVSILGLGLGSVFRTPYEKNREAGHKLLEIALELGINYWDTARAYGPSEEMIGPVVGPNRDRIFLVSKTGERTYDGFMRDLEISLKNLQTDHIDLYHMHNFDPKKDKIDAIEKGAARAARKAREEGTIRSFGVTGHSGPDILIEAVKRFDPDALLTTFPCSRPDNGRYEDELLPLARSRNMGVIAMKTVRFAREADLKGTDLIRYAMGLEGVHVAIVGLDTEAHLRENASMASNFTPLAAAERTEMIRHVQRALAGLTAPWDRPGYRDGQAYV